MKRILYILSLLAVAFAVYSCGKEPVSRPEDEFVEPREVDAAGKNTEINSTLQAIKYIIDYRKNNDTAMAATEILEGGRLVGYKIRFKKTGFQKVYLDQIARDHKYLPVGLEKDGDDYWWTVDGNRFVDYHGNCPKASDALLVFEQSLGGWRFKYDISTIQKLYCKDGEYFNVALLKSLEHKDGQLLLTLSDGLVLTFPWQEEFDIVFTEKGERNCVAGFNAEVGFSVLGASGAASISVRAPEGWDAGVEMASDNSGKVRLRAPLDAVFPAEVSLTVKDGDKEATRTAFVGEGYVRTDSSSYRLQSSDGRLTVEVSANVPYSIVQDEESADWLKVSRTPGTDKIVFNYVGNSLKASRKAGISLADVAGEAMYVLEFVQDGVEAYCADVTVGEFLDWSGAETDYFIIKGRPSDLGSGGCLTLTDGTGSVRVPSLSNYDVYAARFTPSTKLVVKGRRVQSGGTFVLSDAEILYFIDNSARARCGWMELPAEESWSELEFFHHPMTVNSQRTRNYTFYWDYANLLAPMVAYPLNSTLRGTGMRSDTWGLDPLLPRDSQPVLLSPFSNSRCGFNVDRGHQCPSADRYRSAANIETFYGTNMTPQMSKFNQSFWVGLEEKVRYWSNNCDTLYVVTGCDVADSPGYAIDNDGKHVTVPGHYFKVVLACKADKSFGHGGYQGAAVYLDHRMYEETTIEPRMSMSIDDLEAITGHDFFANLPSAIGEEAAEAVESENPADVGWWWTIF